MALTYKACQVKIIDNNKGMFLELSKEGYQIGKIYEAREVFLDGSTKNAYELDRGIAYQDETAIKI